MIVHPAYEGTTGRQPNYRLPESNIGFDARRDIPGWTKRDFDDLLVGSGVFGVPTCRALESFGKAAHPQWKNSGLVSYVSIEQTTQTRFGRLLKARLPTMPRSCRGLKFAPPPDRKLTSAPMITWAAASPTSAASIPRGTAFRNTSRSARMNGHEVHYTAPASVQFLDVKYRETGYNAQFVGEFHATIALNTLWEKARRTLYVTMRDNYMDCPDRERAQSWRRINEIGETFYVFDATNGPLLARKAMLELARWQRADGTLYSPVPSAVGSMTVGKTSGTVLE